MEGIGQGAEGKGQGAEGIAHEAAGKRQIPNNRRLATEIRAKIKIYL